MSTTTLSIYEIIKLTQDISCIENSLVTKRYDINSIDRGTERTGLMAAVEVNNLELVQKILQYNPEVNIFDKAGFNVIQRAVDLLGENAQIDEIDKRGKLKNNAPEIQKRIEQRQTRIDILKLLLAYKKTTQTEIDGFTTKTTKHNKTTKQSKTTTTNPIMIAAHYGDVEVVNMLIKVKADIHCTDKNKMTPFLVAIKEGNWPAAYALFLAGAKPDALCEGDKSAIILAIEERDFNIASLLLSNMKALKDTLNVPDASGHYPLFYALKTEIRNASAKRKPLSMHRKIEFLKQLFLAGARKDVTTREGLKAINFIPEAEHDRLIDLFMTQTAESIAASADTPAPSVTSATGLPTIITRTSPSPEKSPHKSPARSPAHTPVHTPVATSTTPTASATLCYSSSSRSPSIHPSRRSPFSFAYQSSGSSSSTSKTGSTSMESLVVTATTALATAALNTAASSTVAPLMTASKTPSPKTAASSAASPLISSIGQRSPGRVSPLKSSVPIISSIPNSLTSLGGLTNFRNATDTPAFNSRQSDEKTRMEQESLALIMLNRKLQNEETARNLAKSKEQTMLQSLEELKKQKQEALEAITLEKIKAENAIKNLEAQEQTIIKGHREKLLQLTKELSERTSQKRKLEDAREVLLANNRAEEAKILKELESLRRDPVAEAAKLAEITKLLSSPSTVLFTHNSKGTQTDYLDDTAKNGNAKKRKISKTTSNGNGNKI